MKTSKDTLIFKVIVLLSITRWYNVLLTIIAQYIAAFFVFNQWFDRWQIFLDYKLHLIVLCTSIFIAAGYIINFFYDKEVDLINYPTRTQLYMQLSKHFLLNFYFILIFIGLTIAVIASWKIGLFFFVFSFLLWFYSHKLKRIAYVRELSATFLTIASFFSITLHYGHFTIEMFLYGWFIFFIVLIREGIKDIEQIKGNAVYSYYSASIVNNPAQFLMLLKILAVLAVVPVILFTYFIGSTHITLFFMVAIWFILLSAVFVIHQRFSSMYAQLANNLLKLAIVLSLVGMVGI